MSDKPIDWSAGNGDSVEEFEARKNRIVRWIKEHDTEILAVTAGVLFIKNRKLAKENAKAIKTVKEMTKALDNARVKLEAANIFDYYFGYPRR